MTIDDFVGLEDAIIAACTTMRERGWKITSRIFIQYEERRCCPLGAWALVHGYAPLEEGGIARIYLDEFVRANGLPSKAVAGMIDIVDNYGLPLFPPSSRMAGALLAMRVLERIGGMDT